MDAELRGGPDAAAALIAMLVERGASVARVEPVHPTLAEMIERIVAEGGG